MTTVNKPLTFNSEGGIIFIIVLGYAVAMTTGDQPLTVNFGGGIIKSHEQYAVDISEWYILDLPSPN